LIDGLSIQATQMDQASSFLSLEEGKGVRILATCHLIGDSFFPMALGVGRGRHGNGTPKLLLSFKYLDITFRDQLIRSIYTGQ